MVKTMAIRLTDELHAQLVMLAQLDGVPVAEEVRQAIEGHVAQKRAEPDFADRAESVLAEIDREASARRDAIQALFGGSAAEPAGRGRQARKGNGGRGKEE